MTEGVSSLAWSSKNTSLLEDYISLPLWIKQLKVTSNFREYLGFLFLMGTGGNTNGCPLTHCSEFFIITSRLVWFLGGFKGAAGAASAVGAVHIVYTWWITSLGCLIFFSLHLS